MRLLPAVCFGIHSERAIDDGTHNSESNKNGVKIQMYPEETELIDSAELSMTPFGNTAGSSSLQVSEVDILLKLGVILIKNRPKTRSILTVAITEQ